jgi:hypothetical protein
MFASPPCRDKPPLYPSSDRTTLYAAQRTNTTATPALVPLRISAWPLQGQASAVPQQRPITQPLHVLHSAPVHNCNHAVFPLCLPPPPLQGQAAPQPQLRPMPTTLCAAQRINTTAPPTLLLLLCAFNFVPLPAGTSHPSTPAATLMTGPARHWTASFQKTQR